MKAFRTHMLVPLAALVLAGCGSTVKLDETPVETRVPTARTDGAAGAAGGAGGDAQPGGQAGGGQPASRVATVNLPAGGAGGAGGGMASATLGRVVYFDYDSFEIKDDYRALIESHAKVLAAQRGKRLVVEGHTDERGGSEYNLALGQKRANAVAKSLTLLGANEGQVEAVSFGKERPASDAHDEGAWAKNRRAELKDR
jgi:peptidoglycan-associated lipoprotein